MKEENDESISFLRLFNQFVSVNINTRKRYCEATIAPCIVSFSHASPQQLDLTTVQKPKNTVISFKLQSLKKAMKPFHFFVFSINCCLQHQHQQKICKSIQPSLTSSRNYWKKQGSILTFFLKMSNLWNFSKPANRLTPSLSLSRNETHLLKRTLLYI